jgi:hypothetical protein
VCANRRLASVRTRAGSAGVVVAVPGPDGELLPERRAIASRALLATWTIAGLGRELEAPACT